MDTSASPAGQGMTKLTSRHCLPLVRDTLHLSTPPKWDTTPEAGTSRGTAGRAGAGVTSGYRDTSQLGVVLQPAVPPSEGGGFGAVRAPCCRMCATGGFCPLLCLCQLSVFVGKGFQLGVTKNVCLKRAPLKAGYASEEVILCLKPTSREKGKNA